MNKIRLLQRHDIELLGNLYFPWSTKDETVAKWERHFAEQEKGMRMSRVVEQEGKIVGYGHLILHSEYPPFSKHHIPEISDLWVFEGYRKQGIGTFLITHFEDLAQQQGYSQIGIGVGLYRDYGSAQRLYVELGYQPNGEGITYQHHPIIPGEKYPVDDDLILWLVKSIKADSAQQCAASTEFDVK